MAPKATRAEAIARALYHFQALYNVLLSSHVMVILE